jgi:hypothetical protein
VAFDTTMGLISRTASDMHFYKSLVKPIDDFNLVGFNFVKDTAG